MAELNSENNNSPLEKVEILGRPENSALQKGEIQVIVKVQFGPIGTNKDSTAWHM